MSRVFHRGLSQLLVGVLACLPPAGCQPSEPQASSTQPASVQEPAKRIGVTLLTVQHQFYQDLRASLQEQAAKYGYELLITTAEFDPARQADQIDEFIVQRVDAIIICPCDSRSVGASIVQANQADIPVFTADIASTALIGDVVSHIASDNREGGRQAAMLLVKALASEGTVAILSHPEVTSVMDRVAGFKEEIARHPGIKIVVELSAEGKRDRAVKVMEDLLQSYPDLRGVFAINDDSALGALAAIEAAGKLDQIKIVGYDATPEAREKIQAGAIYGDVIQNPRRIGQLTIDAIHDFFTGTRPPAVIPVEVGTFTQSGG
jgi:ribose transport system substrate-binding protein